MCDNPKSPFLTYQNEEEGRLYWFKADCKLWTCPECGIRNRTRVSARVARGVEHWQEIGLNVDFITLTSHEKVRDFARSIAVFRDAWPRLRKRIQYRNKDFHYALFGEQHKKNKTLHVHLVATNDLDTRVWKNHSRSCGLGYMVDVQSVSTAGAAAGYCTKYLAKSAGIDDWPSSFHRYRLSSRWPKWDIDAETGAAWSVFFNEASLNDELRYWVMQGYRLVNPKTGEVND